ncbi:NUDIX domain-containing protein [Bifidobacterium vespertilionis]|uniref:NUDIX domain-containing protein n=1 Tax=Bifidobacterium vespertilionis TaxID=2562524 RepID=UPI001BDCE458|nr:NUDIX hydrolase [Bifidobacterium vespertilionis]MBT1178328.1 NUDIX hydrolase [Bifidobacterium vespertilionis]
MADKTFRPFDPWRPSPVKEVSRDQIVETHYFNVDHVAFESAQVGAFERYFIHENNGDTVAILAVTDDGKVPLIEQYRIANHRWTLELPAGHANTPSERPLDVAIRKLREEAGFEAKHYAQFSRFFNTPGYSTQHTCLFYASGLTPAVGENSIGPESPRFNVRLVPMDDAYQMVLNGTICDAKSMIAILRAHAGLRTLGE